MLMSRAALCGVLLLFLTPVGLEAQVPAELRQAFRARDEAIAKADAASWDRLTADDFTVVQRDGRLLTKAERLAEMHRQSPQSAAAPAMQEQVRVYGDVAVRRHRKGDLWVLETWVRAPRGWRAAAVQLTTAEGRAPPTPAGLAGASLDTAGVRAFVAAFQAAWNARDGRALAALYRADADQILGTRAPVRGRAEIEREWSALLPSLPQGLTNTIVVEHTQFVRPDVAVIGVTGNFAGGRDQAGNPIRRSSDRATYLLVREGGRWELASFRVFDAEASGAATNIRASRDRFVDAWRRGDARAAAAVFASDALNMRPGAASDSGRAAIERMFAEFLSGVTMEHVEFTTRELDVRGYVAFEQGTFVQRYQPRSGDHVTQHGRYAVVWRREPGGEWQYHRFLFNWMPPQQ
jgi:uncharacterized protein (TIGR02246 family)